MRKFYNVHNHDTKYRREHGDWPPDDFIMFQEVGYPLENGEILTMERFVEWEDKYVALVQDFFAALGKETFYIANLSLRVIENVSPAFRSRMAEIRKTKRAHKEDLEPLVRGLVRGEFWCQIATGPVTYFTVSYDLYSGFYFNDGELDFDQLDGRGLSVGDSTNSMTVDPESYEPLDIPPGFFDND